MDAVEVVGLGAMNLDHVYRVERLLTEGETPIEEATLSPGGSAANTIYGLAKLGIATAFMGAVGSDDPGIRLLRDLDSVGVDTSQIRVKPGAETGSVLCFVDRRGRRALYASPGANRLLAREDIDLNRLNQAKVVHFSSFVHREQLEIQQSVIEELSSSVKVSFAPGELYTSKGLAMLAPLMKRTHILFLNRQELKQLTGEDVEKGAQKCLEQGCRIVAVTLGEGIPKQEKTMACYLRGRDEEYMIGAILPKEGLEERRIVDTTGAGDAFAAGVLYGLLNGKNLQECGVLGQIMSSFCINKLGARPGLPTPPELSRNCERLGYYL